MARKKTPLETITSKIKFSNASVNPVDYDAIVAEARTQRIKQLETATSKVVRFDTMDGTFVRREDRSPMTVREVAKVLNKFKKSEPEYSFLTGTSTTLDNWQQRTSSRVYIEGLTVGAVREELLQKSEQDHKVGVVIAATTRDRFDRGIDYERRTVVGVEFRNLRQNVTLILSAESWDAAENVKC